MNRVVETLGVSERFACRVLGQHRATQHRASQTADDEAALTADIVALAREFGRYGYRRVTIMLRDAITTSLGAEGPRGSTMGVSTDAGIGDILSHLNFATMIGAEARYNRFSVMTDLLYLNVNITTSDTSRPSILVPARSASRAPCNSVLAPA